MKELFKVFKDHNNTFMVELVNSSHKYCFQDEFESVLGEADSMDVDKCGTESVVRICPVNPSFHSSLSSALAKLRDAKLVIKHARLSDKLTVLVNDIDIARKSSDTLSMLERYTRSATRQGTPIGTSVKWRHLLKAWQQINLSKPDY